MTRDADEIELPPHAYVPGFSPRHPANTFDDIKASVTPDIPIAELHRTLAYRAGRLYLDTGFFWECHEVLEPVWRQTHDPSAERELVLALIQTANAGLKVAMRQPLAARRLCDVAETRLARCPTEGHVLGERIEAVRAMVRETRARSTLAARRLSGNDGR